ncbi:MAG: dihydrodipicolinate reductase [Pseudomonadota bacterium]
MTALRNFLTTLTIASAIALPATAKAGFVPVKTKTEFLKIIQGKNLKYSGASIHLSKAGKIIGRAYGKKVSGTWQWKGNMFCRSIIWGSRDLGPNCEVVKVDGKTLRFITDHGKGKRADMSLR